jgi:CBS domain-containing membrane protein
MILYGTPSTPVAQPRNLIGGQLIGALVGCAVRLIFGIHGETFVAAALTVSISLFIMQITGTIHAPAGATAVIVLISPQPYPWAGFQFVLIPVLSGSLILLAVAIVINNLVSDRHYPLYWW